MINSAEQFRAINITEFSNTYTMCQCTFCWAQFRMEIAEEQFSDMPTPTATSAIVCPSCGIRSFIFGWMDEENIPYVNR